MRRWLPHIHFGGNSTECPIDDIEGGREGHYIEICWFGFLLSVSVNSINAHRRDVARIMADREDAGE